MTSTDTIGLDNPRACGPCTLCCKLYALPAFDKPAGQWCQHCTPDKGCGIYETRPSGCRTFQCMWTVTEALGDEWRPDIAGFVIASNDMQLFIDVDPGKPDAWRREPYFSNLKLLSARNKERFLIVVVRAPKHTFVVFPETEIELGPSQQGVEIQSGYEVKDGRPTPYAYFVPAPGQA